MITRLTVPIFLLSLLLGCGPTKTIVTPPPPPSPLPTVAPHSTYVFVDPQDALVAYPSGTMSIAVAYANANGEGPAAPADTFTNPYRCQCRPWHIQATGTPDKFTAGFDVLLSLNGGAWRKQNPTIVPLGQSFILEKIL